MTLFVVSDLHIEHDQDPLYFRLLQFLKNLPPLCTIVFAGDIFDVFMPKKIFYQHYQAFFSQIEQCIKNNIMVFYIEGNHDFLMQNFFHKNVHYCPTELTLTLDKKNFYIAHGDLANPHDKTYRALRKLLRSSLLKLIYKIFTGKFVWRVGKKWSSRSKKRNSFNPLTRNIYRSFAASKLVEKFDYVILGHTHDLDSLEFHIGEKKGHYMNMGYPRLHGFILKWDSQNATLKREPF